MKVPVRESVKCSTSPDGFWAAVKILLYKPHVVNKRLWGCKVVSKVACALLDNGALPYVCPRIENPTSNSLQSLLPELGLQISETSDYEAFLIELLPRLYTDRHAFQVTILNKKDLQCTFYNITPELENSLLCPEFTYMISMNSDNVVLSAFCEDERSKSLNWLKHTVLPQFIKWSKVTVDKETKLDSISLVSADEYYQKYNELKLKYGKEMVKIWPECTDPAKFVYEDIAIATYILLLWADERVKRKSEKLQSFVDLGCGNGLLVYLLTKEGHSGVGIDVRKRNIWDLFSEDVKLEERTVTPSDMNLFPETDWLIGNHSDELTPWIPVVAARSSYKCSFFLLPCCAYNFDGSKYRRKDSSRSPYNEYLDHIKQLSKDCGFETNVDRLKIPSTKRICLIGTTRSYPEAEHSKKCQYIQDFISKQTNSQDKGSDIWVDNFKPREATERVRNCTQIDKSIIEAVVTSVANHIIGGIDKNMVWSAGKAVEISELVKLLSQDQLKALKSECGGLQTLLKNNHHIFKVQSGKVQFRYPRSVDEVRSQVNVKRAKISNVKVKEKPCWFHNNHPQGCPLTDTSCSFLH